MANKTIFPKSMFKSKSGVGNASKKPKLYKNNKNFMIKNSRHGINF